MAHIIAVGNATLDIVNEVSHYPKEDSEARATAQRMVLGGNAANSLRVLKQLSHQTEFMGVIAKDTLARFVEEEFIRLGIDIRHCAQVKGRTPTSYITLNQENGSRTIVHYRDLPELDAEHFCHSIKLDQYQFIHFQGRSNIDDLHKMMSYVYDNKSIHQRLSLEVEKDFSGIKNLLGFADTIFFSKDYARSKDFDNAKDFLVETRTWAPDALRVCAWGKRGAFAESKTFNFYSSPAFEPEKVMDTIGAGDTFNAGFIDAQCRGLGIEESLIHACRLAGKKCGQVGFDDLVQDQISV